MPYLSKSQILEAQDQKYEDVEVPEWGGTVRLATLTAAARDRYEFELATRREKADAPSMRAVLLSQVIVDEQGAPLFAIDDVVALSAKNAAACQRVWERALEMNLLTRRAATKVQGS